jgi:aminopeptidase N
MTTTTKPHEIYLKDYTESNYLIENVFLHFDLHPDYTIVKSVMKFHANPNGDKSSTLTLCGEEMQLRQVILNGKVLAMDQYTVQNDHLIIPNLPSDFTLETEGLIKPAENKALSGLYQSKENYCTQCEAQGFRRITYFLDRPDVMTRFTTTIAADKSRYPVLLSNGNLIDTKDLEGNRHWVMWQDPSLKPSYLFALVAGDYEWIEDTFTTSSGKDVLLRVYVEKGNVHKAGYAMESLKRAMKWDEDTYDREYDLEMYMIVAVSDFNMGAMENKGLNIFNDRYILAEPETATDDDYVNIESVIGHEYFHNWSGNRVTVRDWFQITLKEGLTIFRDQHFTADMTSHAVKRIKDVNVIRNVQFPQDAGPMAHPIRPESYIEVNNFYTVTVYNKGSEVIGMMRTLLGKETFRKAMILYFERNDGKAVTTEDFVKAMEDASKLDLTQFRLWYSQAGTPKVEASEEYDQNKQTYTLTLKQSCQGTPGQPSKKDFLIPIRLALLNDQGKELPLHLKGETSQDNVTEKVVSLNKQEQKFVFTDVKEKPLPSLLRGFSAPVQLHFPYTQDQLIFLMAHDTDGFNSWDAGQQLATNFLIESVKNYQSADKVLLDEKFVNAFRAVLNNKKLDKLLIAEMLTLPSESYILQLMDCADIEKIHHVRHAARTQLANQLRHDLLERYRENHTDKFSLDKTAMGQRRLKNLCLSYLMLLEEQEIIDLAMKQFNASNNLTDTMGVLAPLTNLNVPEREQAMTEFYNRWQKDNLVVDKWFTLQAVSYLPQTFEVVKTLMDHPSFDITNPNKTRALVGAFSQANVRFHDKSGLPYAFLADQVLNIDAFNPQLAARLIEPLIRWRRYDKDRQALMKAQLERISQVPKLSNDVYEIVTKSLI